MKIKKIVITCILLMPVFLSNAKQGKVFGTVRSDDGKPIELCVIKALNSDQSAYSNEKGEFTLEYNADSSYSLIFFCLGFETKEIPIGSDTLKVILKRKVRRLDEVVVSADYKKRKIKRRIMGKKNLKPFGICTRFICNESAIFLGADSTRHGRLENIYFYITKEGIPNSRFRVHVYDIDTGYLPGTDLLDSVVILHANQGDEWVSVDVSSKCVPVGRGVFISMEWISGYGNVETTVMSKKYSAAGPFNGQVLSFTEGYYKQGSLYYIRENQNGKWGYLWAAGTSKKNILNPMIYSTYTYY